MSSSTKPRAKRSGPSTPRALRSRRTVEVSLSDTTLAKLADLATRHGVTRTTAIGLAVDLAIANGALEAALAMASRVARKIG